MAFNPVQAQIKVFPTKEIVATQFAEDLLAWTMGKSKFTIALSGGSTPKILFDLLAAEYLDKFNWEHIHFFWGDERCVPPTHADSNYKMTYDSLLKHLPAAQLNEYRIYGENEPQAEAIRYGKVIEQHTDLEEGLPIFDLIILGLGEDGHTASIFPHQMELLHDANVCGVAQHPESGQIRVSLTGKTINRARKVAFLVTGGGKAERIEEIFKAQGAWETYPATFIQPTSGELIWYMDESAASKL